MLNPPLSPSWKDPEFLRLYHREWNKKNKSKRIQQHGVRYLNRKCQVFDLLGWKCTQCGFADMRALQIDHIDGGGNQERKTRGGSEEILKKILRTNGVGYQLLCANCNWIKRFEKNEVPRRTLR